MRETVVRGVVRTGWRPAILAAAGLVIPLVGFFFTDSMDRADAPSQTESVRVMSAFFAIAFSVSAALHLLIVVRWRRPWTRVTDRRYSIPQLGVLVGGVLWLVALATWSGPLALGLASCALVSVCSFVVFLILVTE